MNPRIMRYPGFRFHTWDEPIVVVPKDILLKLQNSKVCDFTRMPQSVEHGITRPRVGSEKPILMLLLMRHDESARVLVLCACASHKSSTDCRLRAKRADVFRRHCRPETECHRSSAPGTL